MATVGAFTLDDLLSRIDQREIYTSLTDSSSENGWMSTLAWKPNEILNYTEASTTRDIEAFVQKHTAAGDLVVGYLSYDFGCREHKVVLHGDEHISTPLAALYSYDNWITFTKDNPTLHTKSEGFRDQLEKIFQRDIRPIAGKLTLTPAWSRTEYAQAYQKVKKYIVAGDIYQVNLAHRLEGRSTADGIDIYRRLARKSEADFRSYFSGGDYEVISLSPERFVHIEDGTVTTYPIKGTRPRGVTKAEDTQRKSELEHSPKDMAELNMITDLLRNDLGVFCEVGTVNVRDARVLTAYPTLWHAHSVIEGRLKPDISPIGALMSLMPGGSITGCPKKRAMEIIDEVEQKRRGVYTGTVFKITPDGKLDSSIVIRTMIKKQNDVSVSVGGGIVYDSSEQDEYNETLQKAQVFLQ